MKLAIVDDLKSDADLLAGYILEYMEKQHIFCEEPAFFDSGEALLESFSPGTFDIIFLDIYMNGMNGMETAKKLRLTDPSCHIIFTTTSPEFAVHSYDVNASFYLLKPVSKERVFTALERCGLQLLEQEVSVIVPSRGSDIRLFLHRISYAEYSNRKIIVHMKDNSTQEVSMSLGEFTDILLHYYWFCDCIKGILINFEDVDKLLKDRFIMKCGATIPISRLKYSDVREKYLNYSYKKIREGQDI